MFSNLNLFVEDLCSLFSVEPSLRLVWHGQTTLRSGFYIQPLGLLNHYVDRYKPIQHWTPMSYAYMLLTSGKFSSEAEKKHTHHGMGPR